MSTEKRPETQSSRDSSFKRFRNFLLRNSDRIAYTSLVGSTWIAGGLNIHKTGPAFTANYRSGQEDLALYYGSVILLSFSGPALLSLRDMASMWIRQNEEDRRERRNQFK